MADITSTPPKVVPTVGRMVYYRFLGKNFPAVIAEVAEDGSVSLAVFNSFNKEVEFYDFISQGSGDNQWDWMPFQKDQVARMAPGTVNESHGSPSNSATGN